MEVCFKKLILFVVVFICGRCEILSASSDFKFMDSSQAMERISDENLEYMKRVLSLADMNNTLLGSILESGIIPDLSSFESLQLDDIIAELVENKDAITDVFFNKEKYQSASVLSSSKATETTNFDECKIDYDEFITPITNKIGNALINGFCARIGLTQAVCDFIFIHNMTAYPNKKMQSWGIKMFDAMGKIPEGIVEGKFHFVGSFDYCNEMVIDYNYTYTNNSQSERHFLGKYCRLNLTPNLFEQNNMSISVPIQLGVCVPDTCSQEDVGNYISQIYGNEVLYAILKYGLNANVTSVYCGQIVDASTDVAFQTAIAIIVILVLIQVAATIYDGFFRADIVRKKVTGSKDDSIKFQYNEEALKIEKIKFLDRLELVLVGFSFYSNIRKIMTGKMRRDHIPVLNGVRYLSFVWLIFGETYVFGPVYFESFVTANTITALLTLPQQFFFQIIINYNFHIDSFLLISGILVTYWFLIRVEKNDNKLSIKHVIYYIVHRYWRLMPALMMTLMFYTCFYRFLADGPLYPKDIGDAGNCRVNWWVDLLMVHNLVRTEYMCLSWMFYVPLIFQLHVCALVILIPLVWKPKIGYILMAIVFAAHIAVTGALTATYRANNEISNMFKYYLLTPWCRAGPFIIGMAFGILLFKKKDKKEVKLNAVLNLLGWIVAIGTVAAVIFSTYSQFKEGGTMWSYSAHAAYDTLARPAFAVAVGWIVFTCSKGHGGIIAKFLGWRLFQPLSKLVYVAILTHALMVFQFVYYNRILLYVDQGHMRYMAFGHLIYCIATGLIFGLIWHYPLSMGLEKAVLCKNRFDWIRAGRYPKDMEVLVDGYKKEKINKPKDSKFD